MQTQNEKVPSLCTDRIQGALINNATNHTILFGYNTTSLHPLKSLKKEGDEFETQPLLYARQESRRQTCRVNPKQIAAKCENVTRSHFRLLERPKKIMCYHCYKFNSHILQRAPLISRICKKTRMRLQKIVKWSQKHRTSRTNHARVLILTNKNYSCIRCLQRRYPIFIVKKLVERQNVSQTWILRRPLKRLKD